MIPDIEEGWQPWRPTDIAERLATAAVPWFVAGGWAVDLHVGEQTREHHDLEVAVPGQRFAELAGHFPELAFFVAGDGKVVPALPAALAEHFQTWALDPAADRWRFDVFREPHDGDVWISRRDERLRRPYAEIVRRTPDGIPYLSPDVVLLFKAKHQRDRDEADFAVLTPRLTAAERSWLDAALDLVHPGHPWRSGS